MHWWRRRQREQDLERELRSDLDLEAAEQQENGLSLEEAQYAARRAFGNTTRTKEEVREMWGWGSLERLWQDIRYALHILGKNYSFTAVAVLSLALGIGANTAIFSVINSVLFRPLPYSDPGRLVDVWSQNVRQGITQGMISYPDFLDLRSQNTVFSGMAAYRESHGTVLTDGDPDHVDAAVVSTNLLSLLGATPELGRSFSSDEGIPGKGQVMVLSHALWQNRFHSDPGIIGRSIALDHRGYTVIGVMPAAFEFPILAEPVQLWIPVAYDGAMAKSRGVRTYSVIARLRTGATVVQAATQMNTILGRLARQYPDDHKPGDGTRVVLHMSDVVGGAREALLLLFAAVGIVLLIACVNVANLILVGATHRSREVAIRTALGAGRLRLVRQFLTENLILALLGGSLGLVLAYCAVQALVKIGPLDIPRLTSVSLDGTVFLFALGISLTCTLIFGLVPSLRLSKAGLSESLTTRTRGATSGVSGGRLRDALVASEIALSLIMVLTAGLLLQTLWHLKRVNPGFDPSHVLTFELALPDNGYSGSRRSMLFEELVSRIRTIPGVTSVSMVFPLPFSGSGLTTTFEVEGQQLPPGVTPRAALCAADRDYFRTMHIPLLEGHDFSERDAVQGKPVAVINEAFAKEYFRNEDPVGERLKPDAAAGGVPAQMSEIIGVIGELKLTSLREKPTPVVFVPMAQFPISAMSVVVRSQNDPRGLLAEIRQAVQGVDRNVLILRGKTLDQYLSLLLGQPRFTAVLLGIFAGLALTLATVGLYGAVSYAVSQRTQEIGIRMAFGATPTLVLKLILGHSIRLIAFGVVVGLILALSLTHVITSLLFGVTANDPITILGVVILLSAIAALACYVPAQRAMHVDPIVALRYE
ncbi:MAG: ADOP family duplicated permease [Bryobacteraceae bacterium]